MQPDQNLLETMSSLRKDVCALAADLQGVVAENQALRHQLDRLRRSAGSSTSGDGGVSDLEQVKREVEELSSLYQRARSREGSRGALRRDGVEVRRPGRSRLRQMMMMMMIMSELI